MKTAIFTICSRNYLAYALTLQKSLQACEPDTPFFIYLADAPLDPGTEPDAAIIPVKDLGLPDMLDMAFRYTVMEFNTAIKADCYLDLLTRKGFDAAIYLDPDIQVFAPLFEVHSALAAGASAALTPHLLEPLPQGAVPSELDILKSGVFNLGFGAFSGTPESLAFIEWWAGQLRTQCYSAPEKGLFVDQRFVDLAPAFIEKLSVLRHPGYNVAYWNLATRTLRECSGEVRVQGERLVFFHFSGVAPGDASICSKHLGKAAVEFSPDVMSLVRQYLSALDANQHAQWSTIPYAYGRFGDGTPILPPMRRHPPEAGSPEDWFAAPAHSYWNAPDPRIEQKRDRKLSRLMLSTWEIRPDLQAAFPLFTEESRQQFYYWYMVHGVSEYSKGSSRGTRLVVGAFNRLRAYLRL